MNGHLGMAVGFFSVARFGYLNNPARLTDQHI